MTGPLEPVGPPDRADGFADISGIEHDDGYRFVHDRGDRVGRLRYGGGMWLIAGYPELRAALRDDHTFSSAHDVDGPGAADGLERKGVMTPPTTIRAVPIEVDPPDYRAYRQLLAPLFNDEAVARLEPIVRGYTDRCIDAFVGVGRADLLTDLAWHVPALVTMRVIGLSDDDAATVAAAVHARGVDRFDLNEGWNHLISRIGETIAARRAEPRDDLVTRLVTQPLDPVSGRMCTDEEVEQICFAFVVGGISTTTKLVLGAFTYYGAHPEERARALDDPARLRSSIEEFLRYYSPVPLLARTATRDVRLGGRTILRGDRVAMGFAAANRDPTVFEDPNEIVLDRAPARHLALGHGMHYCIGAGLGRSEATVMIEQVLRRIGDYRIARPAGLPVRRGRVTWSQRLQDGLPVCFTAGGAPPG